VGPFEREARDGGDVIGVARRDGVLRKEELVVEYAGWSGEGNREAVGEGLRLDEEGVDGGRREIGG
jgi:hypothetical protein